MAKATKDDTDPQPPNKALTDEELSWRRKAVKDADRQRDRKAVEDAYEEREREDANRWRSAPSRHTTGDQWFDVLMNFVEFNEVEPLSMYLEARAEGQPEMARQLRDLAHLLRFLSAVERTRSQKRPQGNPGGTWRRWTLPNYFAAKYAEKWIADWKRVNGVRTISDEKRREFIKLACAELNKWASTEEQKADPERVGELLRRSRRLRI